MSPLQHSNNIAARMGRWSASHWKTAVFGWLAFVVAAVAIGKAVGQKNVQAAGHERRPGASRRQDPRAGRLRPVRPADGDRPRPEQDASTIGDPAFRSTVQAVVARGRAVGKTIKNLRSPLDPAHADLVSRDGHTALVEWDMKGTETVAETRIDALTKATAAVAKAHPGFYVGEAGSVSSNKALNAMFNKQLGQAGERSIPLTLLILRARLRHARRGVHPAPARALGRDRDDRARRPREPPHPDGRERRRRSSSWSVSPSASTTRSSI